MALRYKIVFPLLVLFLTVVFILEFYIFPPMHKSSEDDFDNKHLALLQTMGTALIPSLLTNDLAELQELLNEEKKHHPEWIQLTLYNSDKRRIYPFIKHTNLKGQSGHALIKKIQYYDRNMGYFELFADSSRVHKKEETIKNISYILLSLFLVFIIFIAWVQSRLIVHPIKLLSKAVSKLSQGDFDVVLPTGGKDEIGQLTSSFSKMQNHIKTYQKEIINKANYIEVVFNNIFNATITADENGVILSFNKSAEKTFGYSCKEVLGKNLTMLMRKQDATHHDEYMHHNSESKKSTIIGRGRDVICVRKNGDTFIAEIAINVTEIEGDKVFVGVVRDISVQKAAEKALADQQMLVSTINQAQLYFISSGDPVILFSSILPDVIELTGSEYGFIGEVLTDNSGKQFLKMYASTNISWNDETKKKYELGKSKGMEFHELDNLFGKVITEGENIISNDPVHDSRSKGLPDGHPALTAFLGIALKIGDKTVGMLALANREGGYDHSIVEFLQPVLSTCSQLMSALIHERERKQHEIELQHAKQEAEASVKAKSNFLATMSHEIRTPMNGVLGMLHLLKKTKLNNKQERYIDTARGSGEMLLTVINDVLDFSKMEADKLELESIPFSPLDLVEETAALLAKTAHDKDLELICSIDSKVPRMVKGDPIRLRQILTNLTNNAIKFTESGQISIHVLYCENMLKFSVVDTGIGISAEQQKRLFQSFSQADSSHTRKYGGTGLGLVISQRLVNAMGGELTVISSPGKGSDFSFNLTLDVIKMPDNPNISELLSNQHVLLIDDNKTNRIVLENILESWNINHINSAICALDGFSAIKTAYKKGQPYDFVLLDMQMPEIDGLELAKMIRNDNNFQDVKLIMLSSIDLEQPCPELDAWLTKPVRQSDLYNTMIMLLGEKTNEKQVVKYESLSFVGRKLLLVEDNEVNQQVAYEILKDSGFNIDICDNGKKALKAVQENDYDVVLMDIQMPVMDGLEATTKIRLLGGRYIDLPIIAMTAHALTGDSDKSLDAGMNAHITKPINPDQILNTIADWITPDSEPLINSINVSTEDIPELPGINVAAGLDRMRGNTAAYKRVLLNFLDKQFNSAEIIILYIKNSDWDEATHIAHGIKGSGGNIGAEQLHKCSAELEQACRAQDMELAIKLSDELTISLDEVFSGLEILNDIVEVEPKEKTDKPTIDCCELIKSMNILIPLLDSDIGEAQNLVENILQQAKGSKHEKSINKLNASLNSFDVDSAKNEANNIKLECEVN